MPTKVALAPSLGGQICTGVPNSTGFGADIWFSGSPIAADNNLTVHVDSLPQNSAGYAIHSLGSTVVQNPGGSQGNICIGGAVIGRFATQVLNSQMSGSVSFSPDLSALPLPGGTVAATAGETRYFQYWYRDAVGGQATSNFSSAECLTFN